MIVEDDELFCKSLAALLTDNGYYVLPPVHDYQDAKSQLLKFEPDLALIDISLQGEKDGVEFATYLSKFTQIPVVYITGHNDGVTLQRAKKSHPHAIVVKTKPIFIEDQLVEAVKNQLLASVLMAAPDERVHLKIKPKGLLLKVTLKNPDPATAKRSRFSMSMALAQKKTLIPFDEIQYIATNNEEKRNTLLIKMSGGAEYVGRETIANIEKELPDYFVKIKNALIINIKQVTQCVDEKALLIGADWFEVSEPLRQTVREKKRIYLGHLF
jgi:CheY-like chemotaxis protein